MNIRIYYVLNFLSLLTLQLRGAALSEREMIAIGQKAYIYAYPLVLMELTKKMLTNVDRVVDGPSSSKAPLNQFSNLHVFPDETFNEVVRPNVDTLYSSAWLDLSKEPIILSVPDTHGRYYLMEVMDAWTNVFASLGKRTTGTREQHFAFVGPFWKGILPPEVKKIEASTNMVWIVGRTQTNGKKDYTAVRRIQANYQLTPLSLWKKERNSSNNNNDIDPTIDTKTAPVDQVANMDVGKFYKIFTQALQQNPPQKQDREIINDLKKIGIEPGSVFDVGMMSSELYNALQQGAQQALYEIKNKSTSLGTLINGWTIFFDTGSYGDDYLMRAVIANIGLGANLPQDALYPTAFVDSEGNPLNGNNNYVLHFAKNQLPPVNAFWSITLYDSQSFLVPNPSKRYALGDRDDMVFNDDSSLDIYIQHTSPGKEKVRNWLPSPEDSFNLTLRMYWPQQSALIGKWHPPAVKKNIKR